MNLIFQNKYLIFIILSFQLVLAFFFGIFSLSPLTRINIIFVVLIALLFTIHLVYINYTFTKALSLREKVKYFIYLSTNLVFSYIIGFSISVMISNSKYNFGFVMIPLLIVFVFILVDKYFRENYEVKSYSGYPKNPKNSHSKINRLSIEFENKKYIFKTNSLIIFAIGTPLLSFLIYWFFDMQANYWLHEIVVKQTVYLLNLFFNMGAEAVYNPVGIYHWNFLVPGKSSIYFETFCTGIQAICVFAGLIIFIPHSQDKDTNKNILWRKAKSLIVSSIIFYVVNIIRMLIQIYLYYIGYPWESIHVSISAASSFIAAIIILLLHKWIPEFIISIIYSGTLIKEKFKSKKVQKINHK
jgi:exosortase/archaeosortase family protein